MKKIFILVLISVFISAQAFALTWSNGGGGGGSGAVYDTVANLPGGPATGDQAGVNDGNTASDCTVGGGANWNLCVYNGAAWVIVGDGTGASGSGSITTVESGNAQIGDQDIVIIDFLSGFQVEEAPDTETNVSVNTTPDSGYATIEIGTSTGSGKAGSVEVKYDSTDFQEGVAGLLLGAAPTITGDLALGAAPASTGAGVGDLLMSNATGIYFEAAPAAADVAAIVVDSAELITIGGSGSSGVTITPATTITGALTTGSTIDLGHANDTTIARDSAGVISVQGVVVSLLGATIGAAEVDADVATQAELEAVAALVDTDDEIIAIVNASPGTQISVAAGGSGDGSFTDGGILLGSGTGAFTALGAAANGQIPIGDGTTDPVLNEIDGTAGEVTVTDGAGTITLGIPATLVVATGIELSHATENTLIASGGVLSIEGTDLVKASSEVSNAGVLGDSVAVTTWNLTTPTVTSGATFTPADADPNANGELVMDLTVAGLDDGAFAYYAGSDTIYYLIATAEIPDDADDDKHLAYDKDTDRFYFRADADSGSPTYDTIGDPEAAGSISFEDTETATYTSATTATDQFVFEATGIFGDISIFKIEQKTGNATDGDLLHLVTADADVDHLLIDYAGTDYVTHKVIDAGTYTIDVTSDGTASISLPDPVAMGSTLSIGGALTLEEGESLNTNTDDTFDFTRNDAGTVTITASDDDGTAALTVVAGGAAKLTLGNATNNDISIVTDGVDISETELTYLDGVTSDIQTQINAAGLKENVTTIDTGEEAAAFYPVLVDGTTGLQATETDAAFNYNPNTDTLTVVNLDVLGAPLPADPGADRVLSWDDSETGAELIWGVAGAGDVLADGSVPFTGEVHFENNAAAATFGKAATDADVVVAFDAVTAQGSITYMEDEDRFDFDNDVYVTGNIAIGANPADAGTGIRMSNNTVIEFEDSENTGEVTALQVDAAETIIIGDANASGVSIVPATTVTGTLTSSAMLTASVGITTTDVGVILSSGAALDQSADNVVEITENSDSIQFAFNATDLGIVWSDGALNLDTAEDADSIVNITGGGATRKGVIRLQSAGGDKYITAYHDDTDGWVAASSGDVIIAPDGDVDDYVVFSTATNVTSISIPGSTGTLGTAASELDAIYLNDSGVIYGENDQANTMTSAATGWLFNQAITAVDATFTGTTTVSTLTQAATATPTWTASDSNASATGTFNIKVDAVTVDYPSQMIFQVDEGDGTAEAGDEEDVTFMTISGVAAAPGSGTIEFERIGNFEMGLSSSNGTTSAGFIDLYNDEDEATYKLRLQPAVMAGDVTLTFPSTDGGVNEILTTNGSGVLSWTSAGAATSWSDIADPTNNTRKTITFDNAAEATTLSSAYDTAGSFFKIDNTDADHANNTYLLDLAYSVDDADVDADYIKAQDAGGVVFTLQQDGDMATTGTVTATGGFFPTTTSGAALGSDTLDFSDIFLADAAVINFDSGDVTLTHTSETLTVAGGDFVVTTLNGHTFTAGSSTFTGTAAAVYTFPGVTATLAALASPTFTGTVVLPANQALITPAIGAATGTSLIATGVVDGLVNVTITTDGSETANPAGMMSQIILNQNTTEAAAFAVTLADPPIAGMQLLVKNSYGDGITTGIITLTVPAGDFIWNPTTAAMCTNGQDLVSGGAAGDFVGVVAASTTFWEVIGFQGTWACN